MLAWRCRRYANAGDNVRRRMTQMVKRTYLFVEVATVSVAGLLLLGDVFFDLFVLAVTGTGTMEPYLAMLKVTLSMLCTTRLGWLGMQALLGWEDEEVLRPRSQPSVATDKTPQPTG